MSDTKKKIIEIIEDFLLTGEATETASLADDLAIGTYEFIEMILIVQDTFNIKISDDDMGDLVTVGDLITYVQKIVD